MKFFAQAFTLLSIILSTSVSFGDYQGSSFSDVWSEVEEGEYDLPQYKVSFRSLFRGSRDLIARAASRTLSDKSDLLEKFNEGHYPNKLAHPNGICFSGKWKINKKSPYSGYFKKGSEG